MWNKDGKCWFSEKEYNEISKEHTELKEKYKQLTNDYQSVLDRYQDIKEKFESLKETYKMAENQNITVYKLYESLKVENTQLKALLSISEQAVNALKQVKASKNVTQTKV